MRIKTVGLVIAGAAVVAGAAGGVAWASGGGADTGAEPSVRIVQQEQPAPEQPAPAPDRDCPDKGGQQPVPSSESL